MADDTIASEPILDDAPRIALLHARHPLMLLAERRCVANDLALDAGGTARHLRPERRRQDGRAQDGRARRGDGACRPPPHRRERQRDRLVHRRVHRHRRRAVTRARPVDVLRPHRQPARRARRSAAGRARADRRDRGRHRSRPGRVARPGRARGAVRRRGDDARGPRHNDRLKTLGAVAGRIANASVGFDLARLEPTFKLHLGTPGSSGALAVARRLGLAEAICERAHELLGTAGARVDELLASVADQRRRIEDERAALLAELEAVESDRAAWKMHSERARAQADKQTARVHADAHAALRAAASATSTIFAARSSSRPSRRSTTSAR